MTAPVHVFVLAPCRLFADALARSLHAPEHLVLLGVAADPEAARAAVAAGRVDVLVLWADGGAAATVREVKRWRPEQDVVVLGVEDCPEDVLPLIEAGATGYLPKEAPPEDVLRALAAVRAGEAPCSARVAAVVFRRLRELAQAGGGRQPDRAASLSDREGQVLELIGEGLSNKEIARELGITLCTVKNHVHNLLKKLDVPRRREAVRYARSGAV
jgi:two-component system, NarL family, nitrate/nitrite response regulator NarL